MMTEPTWRKSRFSGGQGNCIEVAGHAGRVLVRDSKNTDGPKLAFSPAAWLKLVARVKAET